jgi:2-phospho-L-lactate guanylyltransferase (CobY/MobA/RfbA family)
MEGATTPLLTHEEVRQLISQSTAGTSAVAPANWGGIAMVAVGSALLVFAVIAHATKRKEAVEDTAQFEAFARSFRGGSNDPRS